MAENVSISVIIPVFNQEKYVGKCIRSVLFQSFQDFEVIIVNDGSTDKSLAICRKYADRDSRVSIIDKQNEGVAQARKEGFIKAKGEYLCFIDGDDYLAPDALEFMYNLAQEKHADMVVGNFDIVYDNWGFKTKGRGVNVIDRMITREEIVPLIAGVSATAEDWWAVLVWGKIIRRSCVLRALDESDYPLFPTNVRLEDHAFHLALAPFIQSVWISSKIICHYRYGGATSRDYPSVRMGAEFFDNQYNFCIQYGCISILPKAFQCYITSLISDVSCQIRFNINSEAEIGHFLLREWSQRKIVLWARQNSIDLPEKMLNDPMIQYILDGDVDAFLGEIDKREMYIKKLPHWRRDYYRKVMDSVGQMTDWFYRLIY